VPDTTLPLEISPRDVKQKLDSHEPIRLLDVREPMETALARIEGSELIPMGSVPAEVQKLEAIADEALLVVYCHHGVRSLNVVAWLRKHGIENCESMSGGIDRWSIEIDPAVPRY
jgi:rhodanese-related sulfurtransferase